MFSNDLRGKLLFGSAHHDAALVRKKFPPVPLLGAVTSAEIGPATGRTILNTGSVALGLLLPA
jgi:small ligand-binding sensory domain FIST